MKKYMNIFTFLMMIVVFAMVLRLLDISAFTSQLNGDNNEVVAVKDVSNLHNIAFASEHNAEEPPALEAPIMSSVATTENKPEKVDFSAKAKYGETIYSDSEIEVLKSLSERRNELDIRAKDIERREALLKATEEEVDKKVSDLVNLKKDIEALLDKQGGMQKDRVDSLVKIYEGMKPGQAAQILDSLEMDVVLAVLGNMKEKKSAPILALMNPKKAREVTLKLASEFKLPETPDDVKQ